ncbi:MAG: hypothetical protein HQ514_01145 [Rhodospirillales bacterium]|nr:hypothetical protein [Rhodospirillales bacterium]
MARSEVSGTTTGRRIVQNAQTRTPEQEKEDAAERILSRRSKAAKSVRRVKTKRSAPQAFAMALFKMFILAGVVVGGIAIIIWMRNFAAQNGIIWIGDE